MFSIDFDDDFDQSSPHPSNSSSSGKSDHETSHPVDQLSNHSEDAAAVSSSSDMSLVKVRRKPMPRKGHTKSRRGCFSCKRRKIKCQETQPKCENCIKAGMVCEYPQRDAAAIPTSSNDPVMQPQSTPKLFTFDDMKYFHYFLMRAYPHLPIGGDLLWTLEIPAHAQECDYLMHSILGLGASHLALNTSDPKEIQEQALSHRIKAVNGLNEAFMRPMRSKYDADARFATLMNLTFQSACMTDGFVDFMTMLRGCVLQGAVSEGIDSSFKTMDPDLHLNIMNERFSQLGMGDIAMDVENLDRGMVSLEALEPYCLPGVETEYLNLLKALVQDAYISPSKAYFSLANLYNIVGQLNPEQFKMLTDPTNPRCQVLLGHFLAVHVITRPIALVERPERDASVLYDMLETWVCMLHTNLDATFRRLHEWPMALIREAAMRKPNVGSLWDLPAS